MTYNLKINRILKYLQNRGWTINDYSDFAYKITLSLRGENFDIIIPKDERIRDYDFRIEQLLKSLSAIEDREIKTIKDDIENIGFDVVKFRFIFEKYNGAMPLNDFTGAVEKIYDIVKFEACSELNPQSQYTNTYEEARQLLSHCEVPHTEKGSYIINLKVPLGETYVGEIKEGDEYLRFLGRNTIVRTLKGIDEAKRIDLTNEDQFKRTYDKKLNKNTCKAIKELISSIEEATVEIDTRWEATKPIEIEVPRAPKLSREDALLFERMEGYLTKIPEDQPMEIQGKLMELKRGKENYKEQTIIVSDINLHRNITVTLRAEDYDRACEMYTRIGSVKIKGILKKLNNKWILEDYESLGIQSAL